jgi:plastocyanin
MIIYAQVNTTFDNNSSSNMTNVSSLSTDQTDISIATNVPSPNSIPIAKSIFDSGTMTLPSSVKGVIIFIPDEAHHPPADQKTISPKNPNYLPNTLEIAEGTEVAFVHNDPGHVHVGIVKDKDGNTVWTTIPVKFPNGSNSKTLSVSGSPYSISDKQYGPPMEGKIVVTPEKSTGALTVGGFFCPTKQLPDCKSQFSKAGFQILSEHNFDTKSVQKDISGPNTLLIYSTTLPVIDAITSLGPIIKSLPYK